MKKLVLNVEELHVASFATDAADESRGTVLAASEIQSYDCSHRWYCLPYPSRGCA